MCVSPCRVVYEDGDKEDLAIAGLQGIMGSSEVATPGLGAAAGVGSKRAGAPTTPAPPQSKKIRPDTSAGVRGGSAASSGMTGGSPASRGMTGGGAASRGMTGGGAASRGMTGGGAAKRAGAPTAPAPPRSKKMRRDTSAGGHLGDGPCAICAAAKRKCGSPTAPATCMRGGGGDKRAAEAGGAAGGSGGKACGGGVGTTLQARIQLLVSTAKAEVANVKC
jgi:hypothetical protein